MSNTEHLVNQKEPDSFWKSALTFYGSATPRVLGYVGITMTYSVIIALIHHAYPWVSFELAPFEYAGAIIGLILVFRINAGYERWWEARKLWGRVVNNSRNLAIIITQYTPAPSEWLVKSTNYVAAMPIIMKNFFRFDNEIKSVKHLVSEEDYSILESIEHRPAHISKKIAELLQEAKTEYGLDSFAFMQAEEKRANIIDCQGACERILKTPMPFVMAIKTRRFILIYLLILPVALVDISIFISPFVTGIIAYALFSLDQIGMELQNPFSESKLSHLPLSNIADTIEKNVKEIQQK